MSRAGRIAATSFVALGLAGSQTAAAQECVVGTAAFGVGEWVAGGITFTHDISDDFSAGVMDGEVGFRLVVADTGQIDGSYSAAFSGTLEALEENTTSNASILISGQLGGTAASVVVDGKASYEIGSMIDVSGTDGVDVFAGRPISIRSSSAFTQPFTTQIVPSFANCGEAIGNLSQDAERPILFLAVRTTGDVDTDGRVADSVLDFLDRTYEVFNEEAPSSSTLHDLLRQGEEVDALVAALEHCQAAEPGSLARTGTFRDIMAGTLVEVLVRFAERAAAGEYSTAEIISAFAAATRGASFGTPVGECVEPTDGGFEMLRTRYEDVLLARLADAEGQGDSSETTAIRVAGLQLGMDRIVTATGGF